MDIQERYEQLDTFLDLPVQGPEALKPECLLTFDYEFPGSSAEIAIDTNEFTAVCPWTGLPDQGTLTIRYVPHLRCIELKSLKYYLLSYRSVGIVQEHAANHILKDLVTVCEPVNMHIVLDYQVRGGLHTVVSVAYKHPGATE